MRKSKTYKKTASAATVLCACALGALGVGLLVDAATVSQGIREGLVICGNVLIPALFPFMVLSGFVHRGGYARLLSLPLKPLTTRIYKLPPRMGVVILLGLVGGYPVGARMVATLLEEGEIDRGTAQRMLCFCVNCGPSFLISAVGVGMLMSRTAGVILFATQTLATLTIGAVVSHGNAPAAEIISKKDEHRSASAFVDSVAGASSAMLTMCAFAVLFSGLLAIARQSDLIPRLAVVLPVNEQVLNTLICGLFEVTAGCLSAAGLNSVFGFGLLSFFASFGGLSILFQIISCFSTAQISFRPFIMARLAHGVLATTMAVPLYKILCAHQTAFASGYQPMMEKNNHSLIVSGCLFAMCSILVLCTGRKNS